MAFWWSAPVKPRNHPCSQLHLAQRTWQARLTSQLIGLIPQQSNLLPWHEAVNDKEQWQGDQLSLSFPGLFCALRKLKIWSIWSHRVSDLVGGVGHQQPEVLFPFAVDHLWDPRLLTPCWWMMTSPWISSHLGKGHSDTYRKRLHCSEVSLSWRDGINHVSCYVLCKCLFIM